MNVILLKSGGDETKDKYIDYIQKQNDALKLLSTVKLINLLEFEYINLNSLQAHLNTLFTTTTYTTLILTSNQAVEAIRRVDTIECPSSSHGHKIDVYCVGDQTKLAFESLLSAKFPHLQPKINKVTTPSQFNAKSNGLELAKIILNQCKGEFHAFFPCSSIRKPDLSDLLTTNGYSIDELFVYNTCASSAGQRELRDLIASGSNGPANVFALFSPSCVDALFQLDNLTKMTQFKTVFITIGPSTSRSLADSLKSNEQLKDCKCVELDEPTPVELLNKLKHLWQSLRA